MNEVSLRLKMFSSVKRCADGGSSPNTQQQTSGSSESQSHSQQQQLGGSTATPNLDSSNRRSLQQPNYPLQVDNAQGLGGRGEIESGSESSAGEGKNLFDGCSLRFTFNVLLRSG